MRFPRNGPPGLLGFALAAVAGTGCGSPERSCGSATADPCGEGQACVCAVGRCARFDDECDSSYRYAAGGCVESAFSLTVVPSTPDDHPPCSGGTDGGADADVDGPEDVGSERDRVEVPADAAYCLNALDCSNDNLCDGIELCDEPTHTCRDGTPMPDGTTCTRPLAGHCRAGLCVPYDCGDGWRDTWRGEECDDGNRTPADGCEPDCRSTCLSGDSCRETPDDPCTVDRCEPLDPPEHGALCVHEPPPIGEVCDYADTDCDGEVDEGMTRTVLADPLRFTDSPEASLAPSLAWNTANYLVAWVDDAGAGGALWARRLTPAGLPMGAAHRVDAAGRARDPALIWTPMAWAVAWTDERRGGGAADPRLAILDTAAVRYGPESVLGSTDARAAGTPSLAWDGIGLGVVWSDERLGPDDSEIWFRRAAADAVPDAAGEIRITDAAGVSRDPAIAWTGSSFAVVWVDGRDAASSGEEQLRFAALDAAGAPLAPDLALTTAARSPRDVRLAGETTRLAVLWTDRRDGVDQLYLLLVDAAGAGSDPEFAVTASTAGAGTPALAWTGLEWGLAWSDAATGDGDLAAAWLPPPGAPRGGTTDVAHAAGRSRDPSLAWAGDRYALAWIDDRDGNDEIYFALVGCGP